MKRCKEYYFIAFLYCLTSLPVVAQEHGVMLTGGWCLPNESVYGYLSQPVMGIGYACDWRQREGWWLGVRFDAMGMRQAIAGTRFALACTIEDRLVGHVNEFVELGLSAYTDPYRRSLDDANLFIGSYVNCHIGVGVRYRHVVDDRYTLSAALRFVHSSNGYLRKPNMGLNYMTAEMGFHFGPYLRHPVEMSGEWQPLRKYTFFCSYAPGVVQQRGPDLDASYFYTHSLLIGALHPVSPIRSFGGEVDLMYNYAHRTEARQNGDVEPLPLYVGICGTYQRDWQRLFMRLSLGTDLLQSPYLLAFMYERISLNYRLTERWRMTPYVGVACKAYFSHIDYIEWTLGVEF